MPTDDARKVLVVDDGQGRDRLRSRLGASGYAVVTATDIHEAAAVLGDGFRPDAMVLGYEDDLDVSSHLARLRALRSTLPIVVIDRAGSGSHVAQEFTGVAVVGAEAEAQEIEEALLSVLRGDSPAAGSDSGELIVGSEAMRSIQELLRQVADTDVSVLITGESGVGKEVVARALHRYSDRSAQAFVKVNCAALPDQLLESELFGYEPGAFTGADRRKPGKFELADGGTIFLDEIGEISAGTQAKLLQVLQDGCYFRLGGAEEIRVDARVVASTNRDLEEEMDEGTFRKDLFYRLNVVRVKVPPLRERRDEIPMLADSFLRRYEAEYGRQVGDLADDTLATLSRHDWPGNVRELQNLIRRMVVLQDVDGVVAGMTPRCADNAAGIDLESLIGDDGTLPPLKEVSRLAALEVEGELIRRALERTGWNRREASRLLDISYKALLYKIRDCGITAA